MIFSMLKLPIALWVVLLAALLFVGEYIWLRIRHAQHRVTGEVAERCLVGFATALRNYAKDNLQRLPDSLDELNLPDSAAVVYRPIPRLNLEVPVYNFTGQATRQGMSSPDLCMVVRDAARGLRRQKVRGSLRGEPCQLDPQQSVHW